MSDLPEQNRQLVDFERITAAVIEDVHRHQGVVRVMTGLADKLYVRKGSGVSLMLDPHGWLLVEFSLVVRRGVDLQQLGSAIQDSVIAAVRRVSSVQVGRVDVHISDIDVEA